MSNTPTYEIKTGTALDVLRELPDGHVRACVTSPPYWGLRDYDVDGQIGLETSMEAYVETLVEVFGEVKRVLSDDGTLWLNLGDGYARDPKKGVKFEGGNQDVPDRQAIEGLKGHLPDGLKPKDLMGIPWRVAFALQEDGWWLRNDVIWRKPNPMPYPATDRFVNAHEYLFLMSKSERYHFDHLAVREEGTSGGERNKRDVWDVMVQSFPDAHFATYPPELVEPCVKAGTEQEDIVLDPFCGSGTTGMVALRHNRHFLGIELNPEYVDIANRRIEADLRERIAPWEEGYPEEQSETPEIDASGGFGDVMGQL